MQMTGLASDITCWHDIASTKQRRLQSLCKSVTILFYPSFTHNKQLISPPQPPL